MKNLTLLFMSLTLAACNGSEMAVNATQIQSTKLDVLAVSYFFSGTYKLDLQTGQIKNNEVVVGCLPNTETAKLENLFEQATYCRNIAGEAACLLGSTLSLTTSDGEISLYHEGNCAKGYYFCDQGDLDELQEILDDIRANIPNYPACI